MSRPPLQRLSHLTGASLASLLLMSACGGGGDSDDAPAEPAAPTALSGSVAVGAPIADATLRVLDANGAVVASDVSVDAEGRYDGVVLTGPAPYRIEACGYAGPNYLCVYSVAGAAGTANVTPLTTATVLLATGQAPDTLMSGAAPALTSESVATAQAQLRTSLASVMSSAGVDESFDFVSGSLEAGSRSGYDGVLDAVGVTLGEDAQPFVQITPRLGEGNLYLEQGTSSGTVTAAAGADTLQLGGVETLFQDMSAAVASAAACSDATTGLQRSMAATAQLSMDGPALQGAAQVAEGLCGFFAQGMGENEDEALPMWGAKFMSPTLGKCDLSGAAPVCGVSFVLQTVEGDVQAIGGGIGVTQEAGVWKFAGDLLPIGIQASARAQRTQRVDTTGVEIDYDRAFAFDVTAVPGLACARVEQRNADGAAVTLGYYKLHPGAQEQERLSLFTADGMGNRPSLDPLAGQTRSPDDTWIGLPQGAEGDAVVRNFYRGGRGVTVSLYANAECSTPFAIGGKSEFAIDVEGVPPLWAAMPNLPWPELDSATSTALRSLAIAQGAAGSLSAGWTFARGPMGLNGATVCGDRAACGEGDTGRIGERGLRGGALTATVNLQNNGPAIAADDSKMLALYGRNGEGVGLQSNYTACAAVAATERCR